MYFSTDVLCTCTHICTCANDFRTVYIIAEPKGEASNRGARVAVSLYVYIYIRHSQFVTPRLRKSHAGASCTIRRGDGDCATLTAGLHNIYGRFAHCSWTKDNRALNASGFASME